MLYLNGKPISPTLFPDQTTQVWKVEERYFLPKDNVVRWQFEEEAEFMQLAQLKALLDIRCYRNTILELPYLPYARQDKEITNESTFAFYAFCPLLNSLWFDRVIVVDPHNLELANRLIDRLEVLIPSYISILKELKAHPVYPDAGAAKRYHAPERALRCEKIREQSTGKITGLKVIGKVHHVPYLIIDDICDGGRTFIEVANKLLCMGAKEVHLYVSHGIFSRGLRVLRDAGIERIFTHEGEVRE